MRKSLKTMQDVHKMYKKNNSSTIDYKTFSSIVNGFHQKMMDKVIQGDTVKFPEKCGTLRIVGRKQKPSVDSDGNILGLSPNWKKTKELWERNPKAKKDKKLVYNLNEHSDNTIYKYNWGKARALIKNKTLYSLRITRTNKRAVSSLVKEGKEYSNLY